MRELDVAIFRWINNWSFAWAKLFVPFSEATKMPSVRVGIVLIVIALIAAGPNTRRACLLSLLGIAMANALTEALKTAIPFARPCNDLDTVTMHVGQLGTYGTASSHAANMAALAFVMVYYFKWWGTPWVLVALLTGLARIYVGVHYPSQVLFGFISGILCAFIVVKTWEAFLRVRKSKEAHGTGESAA